LKLDLGVFCYYICKRLAKYSYKTILNFSLQNFGPVREEQVLTFEADKSDHLEDHYVIQAGGYRLLKLGLIYGANASGKTTILKALDFLRKLVLEPADKKTGELDFNPFLFDQESAAKPTKLSIDFIQNGVRYDYKVAFNGSAIVSEQLDFYAPKKANVFKRKTDLEHQFTAISFGSKIKTDAALRKTLESNTLWNNTVLGGFLKTNGKLQELSEAVDWFREYLMPMVHTKTGLDDFVTARIKDGTIDKATVISILRKADFNVSDILFEDKELPIPDGFIDFLESQMKGQRNDPIKALKEQGKITSVDVELQHTVGGAPFRLPFEMESEGTKRYYGFAGLLALLLKDAYIIPIDELESSLHPDLYLHFLSSFLINVRKSQLLATTNFRELLNHRDIFRNDAIWFMDREESGATKLYSLADFDTSVVRDTSNVLNVYKSGRLGAVPHLGDYYIELNV
jgi:AAA15 family ATPase/GTPase